MPKPRNKRAKAKAKAGPSTSNAELPPGAPAMLADDELDDMQDWAHIAGTICVRLKLPGQSTSCSFYRRLLSEHRFTDALWSEEGPREL